MPSMPALEAYAVVEAGDGTFAVVHAGTEAVVQLDGMPQVGLDLERADDVADHLEAIDRIAAIRTPARFDS